MSKWRPTAPFTVAMVLLIPTYSNTNGVEVKTFPAVKDGIAINGNFKTYGGTERESNGLYIVDDTAEVETWYRSDITAKCRIVVLQTSAVYEILGAPENIELRNQFLKFKVRRVTGGA
jgi:head-tail adaptor